MGKRIKLLCAKILLISILSVFVSSVIVCAGAEELPDDPALGDEQEYGILALEMLQGKGTAEISCGDIRNSFNYDYYEMEIPLGEEVLIAIKPYPTYKIKRVSEGDNILRAKGGFYRILMTKPFMTVRVTYKEVSNGNGANGDNQNNENIGNVVQGSDDSDEGESVSSISYDVVVTNIGTENKTVTDTTDAPEEELIVSVGGADTDNEMSYTAGGEETTPGEIADGNQGYDSEEPAEASNDTDTPDSNAQDVNVEDAGVNTGNDDMIAESTDRAAGRLRRNPENVKEEFDNSVHADEEPVLILSNFPLYLFLVCCMMLMKMKIQMKKVDIDG